MITYVLDASALIRFVDDEAGAERVEAILGACASLKADISISAVQWGEVAANYRKRFGRAQESYIMSTVLPSEATIVPATAERAVRAAEFRVDRRISYADGFALDLAMDSPEHVLVTADYDFKTVDDLARIEFLPTK
jgi:PIN domain nuclease of toxin-antitoxin system